MVHVAFGIQMIANEELCLKAVELMPLRSIMTRSMKDTITDELISVLKVKENSESCEEEKVISCNPNNRESRM